MLLFKIILYFTIICNLSLCLPIETLNEYSNNITESKQIKPNLTFDEFFNYTIFPYLRFSPTGEYLLYQTRRPSSDNNSYDNSLWLYNIQTTEITLITNNLQPNVKPQWSPSGNYVALLLEQEPRTNITNDSTLEQSDYSKRHIYLYSIELKASYSFGVGNHIPEVLAWSHNDSVMYFVINLFHKNQSEETQYSEMSEIYCLDMKTKNYTILSRIRFIKNIPFHIRELLFVPFEEKLIITNAPSGVDENLYNIEIYSLDLKNLSSLIRLTNNTKNEWKLELVNAGKNVLFTVGVEGLDNIDNIVQGLYSLNLTSGQATRIGEHFNGRIMDYTPRSDGGVYILGQLKTHVLIFSQQLTSEDWLLHRGYEGTYASIASSSNPNCSVAFVHSSSQWPMEVYCAKDINDLLSEKQITYENKLFTERNLPQTDVYSWTNKGDDRIIEGILHYPPENFKFKNLPLLVLIHGGPTSASLNKLAPSYYEWASLAASEGWLVLEPNYLGSIGYDDESIGELLGKPLSTAGKDILSGIDQLIADGIADPSRLAVGGCSFGGSLTNWLITQRNDFKAALSCAGTVESVSDWALMDDPRFYTFWFNGTPWEMPDAYKNESPFYELDKVRTPTLICTGAEDRRVPATQSSMLERGLRTLGIPVKLLSFPGEGHSLYYLRHKKMKVREELKWLKKYGGGEN